LLVREEERTGRKRGTMKKKRNHEGTPMKTDLEHEGHEGTRRSTKDLQTTAFATLRVPS
jgi:hypothetical protein